MRTLEQKTLIIEDSKEVLSNLAIAFRIDILDESTPIKMGESPRKDLEDREIDVAESYNEASEMIASREYAVILLDHNLPRYNDAKTNENIGYTLIPEIRNRNPGTIIVGTSSMRDEDIGGTNRPDYKLDKSSINLGENLKTIYSYRCKEEK